MQKSGRCKFRVARKEHGRTWNDVRWLFLKTAEQCVERDFGASCLTGQDTGSPSPSEDQQDHRGAEKKRRPRTFKQLEKVGRKENDIHEDEWRNQQQSLPQRPLPSLPDNDESEETVNHHCGCDGNTISRRKRTRRAKKSHQQQNTNHQRDSYTRDVDLADMRRRRVQDRKARQHAQLDGLMYE